MESFLRLQPSSCTTPSSIAGPWLKRSVLPTTVFPSSDASVSVWLSCFRYPSAPAGASRSASLARRTIECEGGKLRIDDCCFGRYCKPKCSSTILTNMLEMKLLVLKVCVSMASISTRFRPSIQRHATLCASLMVVTVPIPWVALQGVVLPPWVALQGVVLPARYRVIRWLQTVNHDQSVAHTQLLGCCAGFVGCEARGDATIAAGRCHSR